MNNGKIDFTGGSLPKNIIAFTIPILVMNILQNFFIAFDDMIVLGVFAGEKALAAVGSTTYLVNLFVNVFIGISVGVKVVTARAVGGRREEDAFRAVHTSVTAALLFGAVLCLCGQLFSVPCLKLLNTPADIVKDASDYLRIYFFAAPATVLFSFCAAVLHASGNSRTPFLYLTSAGFADILLNLFFVIVMKLDVKGVALGTLISQYLSVFLILRYLVKDRSMTRLDPRRLGIHGKTLREVLYIGIPAGLSSFVFSISNTQIQSAINLFGSAAVAGCSASAAVEQFVYTSTNSVMQTAITATGQNMGAHRKDNIRMTMKWCLICVCAVAVIWGVLILPVCRPLFSLILEEEAVHYAVVRTVTLLSVYSICGIMEVISGVIRGMNYSVLPTAVTLVGACGLRILWVYTVFRASPQIGILFLCFPISWALTAAAHWICYRMLIRRIPDGPAA